MILLQPHTEYELIYRDGEKLRFRTTDSVPEAKHLIKVEVINKDISVDFISLLERPWLDIIELRRTSMS